MLIGGDVVGKKFESNETAETGVLGLINHSHSAATELFDHPVMRDGLAMHNFHLFRLFLSSIALSQLERFNSSLRPSFICFLSLSVLGCDCKLMLVFGGGKPT